MEERNEKQETLEIAFTHENVTLLTAISKYMEMISKYSETGENLDFDGVVNYCINESLIKKAKEISKTHGFENYRAFVEEMLSCKSYEEVEIICKYYEDKRKHALFNDVVEFQPIESKQTKIDFKGEK